MSDTRYPERASLEGLVGEIFKVVSRGTTPGQWSEWLRLPLEHAAADGNIELFNALIGAGADGSAGWRGCEGRTLLHAAASGGNAAVVSSLVDAGAQPDVNVVVSGMSPLFLATLLGHGDAARHLITTGADVNFRDPAGMCDIVIQAVEIGSEELLNDLLNAGANPNTFRGWRRRTPLHIAAESGAEGAASILLARGADKNALDSLRESPLMKAAEGGHLAVVNSLLAAGANVERDARLSRLDGTRLGR